MRCGDCLSVTKPSGLFIERLGIPDDAQTFGYCEELEAFVLLSDGPTDHKCYEVPEDRL